jgi:hypothetical protein
MTAGIPDRAAGQPATPVLVTGTPRRRVWVGLLVLATLAYYFWTAIIPSGGAPPIHGEETDHFNLLSRGFKKGHLYLDGEVPPEIINAPNPYDPKLREKVKVLHDASYYRGRYYIYFGPAPVVTLLLPFSVLTGRDLPLNYAVWFFCSVGYLALVGTFLFLQRRHYPAASLWTITASLIALGGASMVVTLLRRSNIWELSAATGFAYFSGSLFCLVRALHSKRATAWAITGGLALGFAVASRPTYIMCSVVFALPLLLRGLRLSGKNSYGWAALMGAAVSCGIPVLALLSYNYARFENPLEFGVTYQLTSVIESESRHFSLSYVGFNLRVYFLSLLRWLPYFPFVNGIALPPLPPGHGGHEYTFGLFSNLPFSWLSAVMLAGLLTWRSRRDPRGELWATVAVIATVVALNSALLLFFFGCCIRYMVDFTPWFMLLASLGVIEAESRLRGGARFLARGAGLALAMWSAAVAGLSIVNFYDPEHRPPAAYRPIARVLNRPYYWLQQLRWRESGPFELSFTLPADRSNRQERLAAMTRGETTNAAILVEYLDDQKIRFAYGEPATGEPVVFSPAVAAPAGATHTLRMSIGGTYSDFDGLKGRLRAHFDNVAFWDVPVVTFGTYPGKIVVDGTAQPDSRKGGFTGQIHARRAVTMPELARPRMSGIRARITFTSGMAGRSFPLLTTGRTKAGDILFVHMQREGKIVFGYDHWGDALLFSPEISVTPGETRTVEFWVPALRPPGAQSTLLVKLDGATVWQRDAPAYAFALENVFLGGNPIGGSTCEQVLENGVFEDLQLPAPPQ